MKRLLNLTPLNPLRHCTLLQLQSSPPPLQQCVGRAVLQAMWFVGAIDNRLSSLCGRHCRRLTAADAAVRRRRRRSGPAINRARRVPTTIERPTIRPTCSQPRRSEYRPQSVGEQVRDARSKQAAAPRRLARMPQFRFVHQQTEMGRGIRGSS